VGTLCSELAKLGHASQDEATKLFTLFRTWLRRQFALLGREADADALAMHLLARSQGIATLANAFHDEKFIKQEVGQMCDWLRSCADGATRQGGRRSKMAARRRPVLDA
jgi:TetR/AcrR family transcriptional repressor of nem operon